MGLSDLLGKIKDFLALGVKQVLIVFIASWSLLILPESVLNIMGLADLRDQLRPWIGLAAWLSLSWLAALGLYEIGDLTLQRIVLSRQVATGQRLLKELTPVEKGYLALYVAGSTPTRTFRIGDGVAQMLEAKGIIARASSVGKFLDEFDFNIQPWAYRALKANPRLLEGAVVPSNRTRSGY